jgi:hypothetical protein
LLLFHLYKSRPANFHDFEKQQTILQTIYISLSPLVTSTTFHIIFNLNSQVSRSHCVISIPPVHTNTSLEERQAAERDSFDSLLGSGLCGSRRKEDCVFISELMNMHVVVCLSAVATDYDGSNGTIASCIFINSIDRVG